MTRNMIMKRNLAEYRLIENHINIPMPTNLLLYIGMTSELMRQSFMDVKFWEIFCQTVSVLAFTV